MPALLELGPDVVATSDRAATGTVVMMLIIGVIAVLLAVVTVIGIAVFRSRSQQDSAEPPYRITPTEEEN